MPAADDVIWLDVLPSMQKFGPALEKGVGPEADKAGKKAGTGFGKAALAATAVVAGGAVLATKALYNIGATFDDVADTIRVGTGATGKTLDGLIESAKTIGRDVPAAFEDIGTVVADLNTRLGLTGPTLETLSKQFLEAGRILNEEVDVNAVTGAFSAFRIEGDATVGAMDDLFRVSQATGVGMNELGTRLAKSGTILGQLGFGFTDSAALIGVMNKAGVDANAVISSMQRSLVNLAKDGEKPADAFKRVTKELQGYVDKGNDAAALELAGKVFGTRGAGQFISALKSGKVNLEDIAGAAGLSGDTILGVAEETADLSEKWQLFKNRALLAIEPVATRVFNALGDGMEWINRVGVPALKEFTKIFGAELTGGLKAFAAAWTYNDGEITSSGFPGFMERVGYVARQVFDFLRYTAIPTLRDVAKWMLDNKNVVLGAVAAFGALVAITKLHAAVMAVQAVGGLMGYFKSMKIVQAATKAWAAVQWALNAALNANPVSIVIMALVALGLALVVAYKKSETFRNIVQAAWQGIQTAVSWAWNNVIKPAVTALVWYFKNVLAPVYTWLWKNIVVPAFNGIKLAVQVAWNVIRLIFDLIKWYVNNVLAPPIKWLWNNVIKPVFNSIKDHISTIWNKGIKPVFQALGDFITKTVAPAFSRGVDTIKSAWDSIKNAAIKPINFVIETVYNKGIKGTFDKIASAVGSKARLPYVNPIGLAPSSTSGRGGARGIAARAKGGWTRPGWVLVGEEGPELVDFRSPGRVYTAAETAAMQGGIGDGKGIMQRGTDIVKGAVDFLRDPVGAIGRAVSGLVGKIPGGPMLGGVLKGAVGKVKDLVVEKIKSLFGGAEGIGQAGGAGGNGWQWMWNAVRAAFPSANLHSGFRRGAITATGNRSYHAQGRAVDLTPSMGIFNWIASNFGKQTKELIFSPAGNRQIHNGKPHYYSGVTRDMHFDHVHWAYDQGGWLQPGVSLVKNATGKPEAILNPNQWRAVESLASRGVGGGASVEQHIHAGPGQSEYEIATIANRRLGWAVRS